MINEQIKKEAWDKYIHRGNPMAPLDEQDCFNAGFDAGAKQFRDYQLQAKYDELGKAHVALLDKIQRIMNQSFSEG
jgi:hypothetical protein